MENLFKNKTLEERRLWVRQITERLVQAYDMPDSRALAKHLALTHGAVKNWATAGRIPLDPVFQCHWETRASLDWLVHGKKQSVVFDPPRAEALKQFLKHELTTSIRFQMLEEKHAGAIDALVIGMTEGLIRWLDISVIDGDSTIVKVKTDTKQDPS